MNVKRIEQGALAYYVCRTVVQGIVRKVVILNLLYHTVYIMRNQFRVTEGKE